MSLVLISTMILTILLFLKIKIPFLPFDNIGKIQSINKKDIQLSLFLIPLPFIMNASTLYENILIFTTLSIGFLDDKYGLSVKLRFFSFTLILLVYTFTQKYFIIFEINFLNNYFISIFITIFLILGFIHTINMIDGKNGFTILIFLNLFFYIFIKKYSDSEITQSDIIFIIILMAIFLLNLFDISYLGNTGVILLTIYSSHILIDLYNLGKITEKEIYCIFSIPFLDGLRVTINRILKKKSPFKPDRTHLHHLIKNWNLGLIFIFLGLIFMSFIALKVNYNFIFILIISIINYTFLYFIFKKN